MAVHPDWERFVPELQDNILPLYTERELTGGFDPSQVHGRLHICRSILFSEWMARFHDRHFSEPLDHYAIWMAVAFHDSMREDGGADRWEAKSAAACQDYLQQHASLKTRYDPVSSRQVADWILKKKDMDHPHRIAHDADVLEIMRLRKGKDHFDQGRLCFPGSRDSFPGQIPETDEIRKALIKEAQAWINLTKEELRLPLLHSQRYMEEVVAFLEVHRREFPLLAEVLT